MSDMLDVMKSRRSIKKYKSAPVADELLDKIVEAGLYAANGRGNQNSIIIKVTDKKKFVMNCLLLIAKSVAGSLILTRFITLLPFLLSLIKRTAQPVFMMAVL